MAADDRSICTTPPWFRAISDLIPRSFIATHSLALTFSLVSGLPVFAAAPLIPMDEITATPEAGYGRAFGRIVVVEQGKERTLSIWDDFRVRVRSLKTDQTQSMTITGDGRINWPLKPGDYVLQSFSRGNSNVRLWMSFSVPEPGQAVYVGDLRVISERNRFHVVLHDAYADAIKQAENALREMKLEPVKALMRPEIVGSYKRVVGICADMWEIECNRTYQGVAAVLPEGTNERSPMTTSLTPFFEWSTSKLEKVTYDVAIYESESLNLLGTMKERGKLAAYVEGLREPKFQLEKPLEPGRKYLWSIRLRKDETVSSWTTTSYFAFFIIGAVSGSGQWYSFITPDK
jgi:hypothetical protein